jgi:SUKH-3 immunity protein
MVERSKPANEVLLRGGWFPGRKVNLQKAKYNFRSINKHMSLQVESFLSEFDKIHFWDDELAQGYQEVIKIDAAWYSKKDHFTNVTELERINAHYGVDLIEIGSSNLCCASIWICQDAKIWVNYYQLSLEHGIEVGRDWNEVLNEVIASSWNLHKSD